MADLGKYSSSDPSKGGGRGGFLSTSPLNSRGASEAGANSRESRPNILWIMTDQQFANAMSCAGSSDLATPAMDWIAAHGVRYENAYCTDPICVPSRASMITGRYPHEIDINTNYDERKLEAASIGELIRLQGYDTGYVGKWHIPRAVEDSEWAGFNFIRQTHGNGTDGRVASCSIEFMTSRRGVPWFLVSSFHNPHDICEWARMASGISCSLPNGSIPFAPPQKMCPDLPENYGIPKNEPSVIRELKRSAMHTYPTEGWSEAQWRQYRWAYFRLIEKVDAQVGGILDGLRLSGQVENTVILFTSDHGDGMGSHEWNQKTLFYEECSRVPFIIAGRGVVSPGRVDGTTLVSTGLDIAQTLADYSGGTLSDGCHGLSARPSAEKRASENHDYVVAENDLAPRYGETGGVYGRMLRTSRYKYVVYSQGENPEQLFDMKNDRGEMENLANQGAYEPVLHELRELLRSHIKKTSDFFTSKALESQSVS